MWLSRTALPLLLVLGLPAAEGVVDLAGIDPSEIEPAGAPNAAFLGAVDWHRLQTDVVYLRPGAPLPEGEVAVPESPGDADADAARRAWMIAAGVVLAAVLAFAAWYGRGTSISFGSTRDPARHRAKGPRSIGPAGELPPAAFLERLRAMPDRRQALILLVARALERTAEAHGLRLGRAQTAREVLRALPRSSPHLGALRRLVSEAELVHFGGRDLAEERWGDCLDMAGPLLGAGTAA